MLSKIKPISYIYLLFLLMGNQQCCDVAQENYKQTFQEGANIGYLNPDRKPNGDDLNSKPLQLQGSDAKPPKDSKAEGQSIAHYSQPALPIEILEILSKYEYLDKKSKVDQSYKYFGTQLYVGQLDFEGRMPKGYGKIYKSDGSVYLGHWKEGKANGEGVYVMKNGSYYDGAFHNNKAEGIGKFISKNFYYEGHFVQNKFQGVGTEKGENHTYHGEYFEGCKEKGIYKWQDKDFEYEYHGKFNFNNEFQGQGILKEPNGIYKGEFLKGEKHGKGVYDFAIGLKYEGDYVHGKKEGKGTLFNYGGAIAYSGQFQNDIPHGQGVVFDKNGNKLNRRWVRGIDAEGLQENLK